MSVVDYSYNLQDQSNSLTYQETSLEDSWTVPNQLDR